MNDLQGSLSLLDTLGNRRVLVLGDLILDRYIWGNVSRTSLEAPVLILQADQQELRLGGAASVGYLTRGLGVEVRLVGLVGGDGDGARLQTLVRESGIDAEGVVVDPNSTTTVKERFIGRAATRHPQQMLRVDYEVRRSPDADQENRLLDLVQKHMADCQAVLISDYDKGVCTPQIIQSAVAQGRSLGIPVLIDPAAIRDYSRYRGATLVTPNRLEAQLATGIAINRTEDAFRAGEELCRQLDLEAAIVTLDRDGMALVRSDSQQQVFPTTARDVYDITGAGDMVLSMLGRCLADALSLEDSVRLSNVAAGVEVQRVGVQQVTLAEIRDSLGKPPRRAEKIVSLDQLVDIARDRQRQGRRVVFTNGCFDVLHYGHTTYLEQAAGLGDLLVVGLNSDASVCRLRGPGRPVNGQADRAGVLAALACVDYVVIFEEDTPHAALLRLRPDVLVKGGDYTVDAVAGKEIVEAYGGNVCVVDKVRNLSSSIILRALSQGSS